MPAVKVKFMYFEIRFTVNENCANRKNPLIGRNVHSNEKLPPIKSMLKSWADETKFMSTSRNFNILFLRDDGERVRTFVSVICEKNVETPENPGKRNPFTIDWSGKLFVNPFKRIYFDMQDNGEKLVKTFASLSQDQKEASKNAVF